MTPAELQVKSRTGATTDIGAIWNAAVDHYEDITDVKIGALAGSNSVQEILAQIQEREMKFRSHRHDGSKLDKLRTLVANSLTPIQLLGGIVAHATKTVYPPAEALFAAIRYLISTANAVSADYDKISEIFEDLSEYLNRLKILEHQAPLIPELEEVLTEVFTSVLILCGICAKYVKMKRIVKTFRSLVSGEDDELKSAYDHFHKMVAREQGIVQNMILLGVEQLKVDASAVHADVRQGLAVMQQVDRNTKISVTGTGRIHKYLESQEVILERENILNFLSSLDFRKKQRDTFAKHHKDTGSWFLNTEKFQCWLKGRHNSTLWCVGIPGAGKTVMASLAISHTEEITQGSKTALAYVYCDYKDPRTQSEIEILSSITRQLAEQIDSLPLEVKTFRDKYIEKRSHPSDVERISLVKAISSCFEKTYVFIDALDECPETNREKFLSLAKNLESFVSLFITSRPHLDLHAKFANISHIDIVAHDSDIQTYLESEICASNRMSLFTAKDPTLTMDIVKSVNGNARGMFLLAHLQILYLCGQSSFGKVRKSLNALPTGVYGFYGDAMKRIEDQSQGDMQLAKRALSYIFCARRPLNVEELRQALSVEPGDTELDGTTFPETEILLNISAGLIRVDEKSSIIRLVHHTFQEYLQRNPDRLLPEPQVEMAMTCLTYLSFDIFQSGPCNVGDALEQRLQEYRFLDYASHNWGTHLVDDQLHRRMALLLEFLENERKLASFVQVLYLPRHRMKGWYNGFPRDFSPLHVVAYWGLEKIFIALCKGSIDINSQDSYGATALHLAAQHSHQAVVRLLIEKGAKIYMRNNRGETALSLAARSGHLAIVELLIPNMTKITMKDDEGWTALDWAIIGGYKEVARVLLDHLSDDDDFNSIEKDKALLLAANTGNETTVQMLLDIGAEINCKDNFGSTPITFAVPAGHEKTVHVLLKNGADVNSKDIYENTPLHWAISHERTARLLLENGANVDARNNLGQTALLWSAQDQHADVLQLLLHNNAEVNEQDIYGFTALHATALKGYEAMAQILLNNSANPNAKDKDGWTPLHAAALKQHEGLVRLLLDKVTDGEHIVEWAASQRQDARKRALLEQMAERKSEGSTVVSGLRIVAQDGHAERVQALLENGAEINARDTCGCTALTQATKLGLEKVVRVLLENGADVNRRERDGRSALHLASERGHYTIVQLLVEHGADLNASRYGWTAVLLAAKGDHESIVQYLAQNGANINAEDYHGRRALHWIAKHGDCTMVRLLIDNGANVNAVDLWGRTVLMWAIERNQLAVMKLLLKIGEVDIERKTRRDHSSALHLATYLGEEEAVRLLLARGASVDARTRLQFAPLHIAALLGQEAVARLLLEKGANIEAQTQRWSADNEDENENDIDADGDDADADNDGGVYGTTRALSKNLQQVLFEQVQALGASVEAQSPPPPPPPHEYTYTVRQLAALSRNVAIQQMLA